ncbi:MAG: ImmA/IrrE family metallo-endopeptidase [Pseudoflavonifractor sp.]|nr:ImmA/IrrE family metallo-endopeptidase [Pseudoflavonifractor sp.]
MKASLLNLIEQQVSEFRQHIGLSDTQAVNLKSLLLKLNVLTVYRPLSKNFSGMSLKSPNGERFMLINCNQPRGRQHFTIAHELYHLYIEENPIPHNCEAEGSKSESEQCADAFALMFLMPHAAILQMIPAEELKGKISLATVIRLEHYFSVSHQAIVNRLFDTKFITRQERDKLLSYPAMRTAQEYGYDTSLYLSGNENLIIGNFGEKARRLYDEEKISEGHYRELLNKIGVYGE